MKEKVLLELEVSFFGEPEGKNEECFFEEKEIFYEELVEEKYKELDD